MPVTTKLTHIDGVEIITSEPAIAPHPRTKEPATFKGVAKVLLADGRELLVCEECGQAGPTVMSVANHANGKHRRKNPPRPLIGVDSARIVIREALTAQRSSHRDWAGRTAEKLNELQVPTGKGNPWTPAGVSSFVGQWGSVLRVKVPGGRTNGRATRQVTVTTAGGGARVDLYRRLISIRAEVETAITMLEAMQPETVVDPEVVAKAKKWDDLQKLMGRS